MSERFKERNDTDVKHVEESRFFPTTSLRVAESRVEKRVFPAISSGRTRAIERAWKCSMLENHRRNQSST